MSDENVIDFNQYKNNKEETQIKVADPVKQNYEFHFFPGEEGAEEIVKAEGYLKFGPQFLAVLDGVAEDSTVVFACSTAVIKYIKKLDSADAVQATLSL